MNVLLSKNLQLTIYKWFCMTWYKDMHQKQLMYKLLTQNFKNKLIYQSKEYKQN